LPVRIAAASPLPQARTLLNGMRPLMRCTRSRVRFELDVEATVRQAGETRCLVPVLRGCREPAVTLNLVRDIGASLPAWEGTIHRLAQVARGTGRFAAVHSRALQRSERAVWVPGVSGRGGEGTERGGARYGERENSVTWLL